MIIVDQEKNKIINLEQMTMLYIDNWSSDEWATEPDCFCIKAEKASNSLNGTFLGQYKTEERAKEVLNEMLKQKAMFELYKLAPTGGKIQTEMLDRFAQKNIILDTYEMPKE